MCEKYWLLTDQMKEIKASLHLTDNSSGFSDKARAEAYKRICKDLLAVIEALEYKIEEMDAHYGDCEDL